MPTLTSDAFNKAEKIETPEGLALGVARLERQRGVVSYTLYGTAGRVLVREEWLISRYDPSTESPSELRARLQRAAMAEIGD